MKLSNIYNSNEYSIIVKEKLKSVPFRRSKMCVTIICFINLTLFVVLILYSLSMYNERE